MHLQLWVNVDVLLVASWQELSQHVCAFTKALAQRPFKCVILSLLGAAGGGRGARVRGVPGSAEQGMGCSAKVRSL